MSSAWSSNGGPTQELGQYEFAASRARRCCTTASGPRSRRRETCVSLFAFLLRNGRGLRVQRLPLLQVEILWSYSRSVSRRMIARVEATEMGVRLADIASVIRSKKRGTLQADARHHL